GGLALIACRKHRIGRRCRRESVPISSDETGTCSYKLRLLSIGKIGKPGDSFSSLLLYQIEGRIWIYSIIDHVSTEPRQHGGASNLRTWDPRVRVGTKPGP